MKITKNTKFYDLADWIRREDWEKLGLWTLSFEERITKHRNNIKAVRTGEFRPPRKGEWYISGAIPQAYYCINNTRYPMYIAKLVLIEKEVITKIRVIKTT